MIRRKKGIEKEEKGKRNNKRRRNGIEKRGKK